MISSLDGLSGSYRGGSSFERNASFERFLCVEIAASCFELCGCNFEGMKVHIFSFHFAKSPYLKLKYTQASQGAKCRIVRWKNN